MKKSVIVLFLAALIIALPVLGCKSKPKEARYADDPRSRIVGAEGVLRPEWMNGSTKSDSLYYVIGTSQPVQTRPAKENSARNDAAAKLAQWKSAVVLDAMKTYQEEGGTTGNTQALTRFEQATITRSQANVAGFNLETYWVDQNGIYHGLFSYPKDNVKKDFNDSVSAFQRNEAAAFADFKAQEAFRQLEAQMNK